jgi:hypothetical protein
MTASNNRVLSHNGKQSETYNRSQDHDIRPD